MNIQFCKKCLNCQNVQVNIEQGIIDDANQLVHIMKPIDDKSFVYTNVCIFLFKSKDYCQFDKIPADSYKKCRFYFENKLLQLNA